MRKASLFLSLLHLFFFHKFSHRTNTTRTHPYRYAALLCVLILTEARCGGGAAAAALFTVRADFPPHTNTPHRAALRHQQQQQQHRSQPFQNHTQTRTHAHTHRFVFPAQCALDPFFTHTNHALAEHGCPRCKLTHTLTHTGKRKMRKNTQRSACVFLVAVSLALTPPKGTDFLAMVSHGDEN